MTRTIQQQLTLIQVLKPCDEPAPKREKSRLRQRADRAGIPPDVQVPLETAVDSMLEQWSAQYLAAMRQLMEKK
jgi:hypothetical protein